LQLATKELQEVVSEVDILVRQGRWGEASFILESKVRPLNVRIGASIDRLVPTVNRNAERAVLRAEQAVQRAVFLLTTLAALTMGLALSWRQVVFRQLGQSIALLRQGVARVSGGELGHVLDIHTGDEIEELANDFNEMAHSLQASQARLERWGHDLEVSVVERTRELQQALEEQRRLSTAIREMSTPVVPVHPGVIVMPLVGVIDAPRARQIVTALLEGVESHDGKVAIIDITGIPVMDSEVAGYLVEASQAARLLGAQVVLVGIKPEVAKAIVGLGVDLTGIATRSDLQAGIEYALGTMGLCVTGNGA
jgi:anti-anti-sigma factor